MKKQKKYSIKQITKALRYWNDKLNESEKISEDVNKVMKVKRQAKQARQESIGNPIEAGDPMWQIVEQHKKAVEAAVKACKNELKGADDENASKFEKISIFNSCIKDGRWVDSGGDGSTMVITASIHMPSKKGALSRLFTGSLFKLGGVVGVEALREYTKVFLGKSFARQVDNKHVFDGIDEQKDRVKYYVSFKLLNKSTKLDEDDEKEEIKKR